MSQNTFDVLIIGAGPGGYVCAIRCAQLGLKTAVIDKGDRLGGTCLNIGCIPSKALLESSEHYYSLQQGHLKEHGIETHSVQLQLGSMMKRKEKIVQQLTEGIAFLFKKNKITFFQGKASLKEDAGLVEVHPNRGKAFQLQGEKVVLATGSVPIELPFLNFDGKKIISSTEALSLTKVPKKMVVIGGGYIGLELGSVWSRLGSKVTIIEAGSRIASTMDGEMSQHLKKILEKQGIQFLLETKVEGQKKGASQVQLLYRQAHQKQKQKQKQSIDANVVLVAVGRRSLSTSLGPLQSLGIECEANGFVKVNEQYETTCPNIYAIGDLIQGPMLAHKAEEEGVAVAEILAKSVAYVNYKALPGVIYTWPEAASVGKTEEQLQELGENYKKGSFPFVASGRAKALGCTEGWIKVLAHAETDRLLGVHILGPNASEVIAEATLAMEFSATAADLACSFHAHPTLAEGLREASLDVHKRARQK